MARWFDFGKALTLVASIALFAGCEQQGPAERAGESLDESAQSVQDALDPRGPAEKTGSAVDDALDGN